MIDDQTRRLIEACHDGELDPGRRAEVAHRLASDPALAQYQAELREMSAALRRHADAIEIDPARLAALHRRLDDSLLAPIARLAASLIAVAAIVLLACSIVLWQRGGPGAPIPPAEPEWALVMPDPPSGNGGEENPEAELARWIARELN